MQQHYHGSLPTSAAAAQQQPMDETSSLQSDSATGQQVAQLKDEIQILKARLAEAENVGRSLSMSQSEVGKPEAKKEEAENWEKKFKEIKTKHHAAMLERADMQQVNGTLSYMKPIVL